MDLNHIAVFVRVVEVGSFTAAGDALGLPKSSVSRIVARLEEDLGVRLLQRTTRSLHLTDTGRRYYERARQALSGLDEASTLAADDGTALRGVVRMTAPVDIGAMSLAELLARFTTSYPEVHVELSLTGRFVDLVDEGFDLAIRGGRLEDSSLIARKVGTSDFGLFASPQYIERRGEPASLEALREHACVMLRGRDGRADWELTDESGTMTTVSVRGPLSADELIFVRQAIEAGAGVGTLPLSTVAKCARAGHSTQLVRVLPTYAIKGGAMYVVTPPLEFAPRRVLVLRDFLVEQLTLMHREP